MYKNFRMGLKPLVNFHFTNPPINRGWLFTEVNGNKINSSTVILPSALADGYNKLLLEWALATFVILSSN